MKKTKVIIPALGLLLLSTAASVTGTVAWFAANTTVTANGMPVTAKSDSTFLLIKAGTATLDQIRTGKLTSDTAVNASAALLPAAHNNTVTNITTADTVSNWYYKTSDDPSVYGGEGKESEPTALTAFTNYVLVNEFSLGIAAGGNSMSNLKVGNCTLTTAGDAAVKVLVATSSAVEEFSASGAGSTTLQASLDTSSVMTVKVYIYWDGEDADVYTNGISDLQSTSVSLTFTGSVVQPA